MLVAGLPLDSAMHRAVSSHGGWRDNEHLLASQIDATQTLIELLRAANSDDSKFHTPDPFPRPADRARIAAEAREAHRREAHMRSWWRNVIEPQITEGK